MLRSVLSACYKMKERLRLKLSILLYTRHLNRILPEIASRRPVRVMFYVNNLSMWKSDKLLMMLKNARQLLCLHSAERLPVLSRNQARNRVWSRSVQDA